MLVSSPTPTVRPQPFARARIACKNIATKRKWDSGKAIFFIIFLVPWLGGAPAWAATPARAGIFKTLEGEVAVLRAGQRLPALSGAPVWEGDRVLTGPNSAAALTLADGTVLTLGPNATADLVHHAYDPTTQSGSLLVQIVQGALRMLTGAMAKTNPQAIKVTTPTAVIGVRGTDFIVEANP